MSRHYGEGRCELSVGYWNTGVSRHSHRGADTGNDFKGNPCVGERFRLFTAPAEDERIAALEPHNLIAEPRVVDEYTVDFFLSDAVSARLLADIDPSSRRPGLFKKRGIHQLI